MDRILSILAIGIILLVSLGTSMYVWRDDPVMSQVLFFLCPLIAVGLAGIWFWKKMKDD